MSVVNKHYEFVTKMSNSDIEGLREEFNNSYEKAMFVATLANLYHDHGYDVVKNMLDMIHMNFKDDKN